MFTKVTVEESTLTHYFILLNFNQNDLFKDENYATLMLHIFQ